MASRVIRYADEADGVEYTVEGPGQDREFWVCTETDLGYVAAFDVDIDNPGSLSDARLIEMAKDAVAEERENW